jgi:hypothetical protein
MTPEALTARIDVRVCQLRVLAAATAVQWGRNQRSSKTNRGSHANHGSHLPDVSHEKHLPPSTANAKHASLLNYAHVHNLLRRPRPLMLLPPHQPHLNRLILQCLIRRRIAG